MLCIIKPTHDCNLNCSYCYAEPVRKITNGKRLSLETLNKLFIDFFDFGKENTTEERRFSFMWHGGEPMLLPIKYYKEALKLQKNAQLKIQTHFNVTNRIQSNLTLLTPNWIDFLSENNWYVATSIDGPEEIHDWSRYFPNNIGSFKRVFKAVNDLKKANVGVGAVCILTRKGIKKVKDIYNFFNENSISFRINPLSYVGYNSVTKDCILPEEYAEALIQLFDIWYFDKSSSIKITTLIEMCTALLTGGTKSCSFGTNCAEGIFAVGAEGEVYPCGRFCGDKRYVFGNIDQMHITNILSCNLRKDLLKRKSNLIEKCRSCDIAKYCKSGCMHDSLIAYENILTHSPYCEVYKMVFSHIKSRLEESDLHEQVGVFLKEANHP